MLFLCLCDLGNKECHKAATCNCVPQGMGRARHIPPQTDTVVRFAPEHVVLFLCLCYLVSKGATKATTPNCVSQSIVRARHSPTRTNTVVRFI